jgi:integrase
MWDGPKFWRKMLTPSFTAETEDAALHKEADKIDVFSIEELAKLYKAADERMQCWILAALNFAWGAKEISTSKPRHWKTLEKGGRRVERIRHKKRRGAKPVRGYWLCWNETWDACHDQMKTTPKGVKANPDGLAFLHVDGRPLVRPTKTGRHDAIDTAFEELCETAKVRRRGFYMLRRTSIDMIDGIAGDVIADLQACHARRGMNARYTNKRFGRLRKALRIMRKRLQPMFTDAVDTTPSK